MTAKVAVATNSGHFEHLQQLCPSPSLHPPFMTNKPAAFRTTSEDYVLNADKWGLSRLKQRNLVIFKYNSTKLGSKVYILCLTLV